MCAADKCGEVVLVVRDTDGRTLSLCAIPVKRYALSRDGQTGHLVDTYEAHFETCPGAGWWRKRERDKAAVGGDG